MIAARRQPSADDPDLTTDEAEEIRLAMEQADRGELVALDDVMDELGEELAALEQVQLRRAG